MFPERSIMIRDAVLFDRLQIRFRKTRERWVVRNLIRWSEFDVSNQPVPYERGTNTAWAVMRMGYEGGVASAWS